MKENEVKNTIGITQKSRSKLLTDINRCSNLVVRESKIKVVLG